MRNAGLILLLGTLACAGGDAKAAVSAATQTAAPAVVEQDSPAAPPSRPVHLARSEERAPTTFPHAPHLRFDCSRCHAQVAGHERHANVACRQCHEAPAPTPARASAPDCNACHHAANRAADCRHCHERAAAAPPPSLSVPVEFRVAGRTAARTVSFVHARHARVECTRCHTQLAGPRRPAVAQCGSCHERHHQPAANCAACHAPPRAGVHDVAVHRGCGGNGCHQDQAVLALPFNRSLCLACHPAQAQHEPAGDCAGCHRLRPPAAAAAPGTSS